LRSPFWADKEGVKRAILTTAHVSSRAARARTRIPSHTSASGEAGFTLVELLVVVGVAVFLIAGIGDLVLVSVRQADTASSRTVAARQAEVFLARLTREVRQAQYIQNSSTGANETPVNVTYSGSSGSMSSSVSFSLPKAGSTGKGTQVTWSCTANASCTRQEAGGATVTELTGVGSATFKPYGSSGVELASGAGAASSSYPSSVLINLSVKQISQQDSGQTHTVATAASPIVVQDGVALRNYS
jgi:type II secretory pathway pseudopilin PulG